jgi:hypothetical protein
MTSRTTVERRGASPGDNDADLRAGVWRIYDLLSDRFYLGRPDVKIRGRACNTTLLMSLLTALGRGRVLIIGEPGLGKTTSAEYVCALAFRLPLGVIWRAAVSGHPEQTEEKIIARPDLGALNQGLERVIWSYFALLPPKIVDEINRLPETKQSLILDGIDRGKWTYLNEAVVNREFCFFATANYADQGTHTLVAPLMDRFDIMIESKHPGANLAYRVGAETASDDDLRHPGLEAEFERLLSSDIPLVELSSGLNELCNRFGGILQSRLGAWTPTADQRDRILNRSTRLSVDLDANAFLRLVICELSFCFPYGQKRNHEECEEGCHFAPYLCHATRGSISNRFPASVLKYARMLAWMLGDPQVDVEHIATVLPYCLAHRVQWKSSAFARWDKDRRSDPLPIYMAKQATRDLHRRYAEQAPRIREALTTAFMISKGETRPPVRGDHPLFWDICKDLDMEGGSL